MTTVPYSLTPAERERDRLWRERKARAILTEVARNGAPTLTAAMDAALALWVFGFTLSDTVWTTDTPEEAALPTMERRATLTMEGPFPEHREPTRFMTSAPYGECYRDCAAFALDYLGGAE